MIWREHYNHPAAWDTSFNLLSVPDMLLARAEEMPLAQLIDFMGRKYSYADVASAARRVAKGLLARGMRKGDRVGLFLPNVPHYVAAYYGAMMMGAIVVNFSPLYTLEELKHQAEDSGTKLLFTLSVKALLPRALDVMQQSCIEQLVVGSVAGALPIGKSLYYRFFKADGEAEFPAMFRAFPSLSPMTGISSRYWSTRLPKSRCCNIPAAPPARPRVQC